jgi:hypothetical protein
MSRRSHPPNRPRKWTIGGGFAKSLDFAGEAVLLLEEGAQTNADNLPKLIDALNAAGVKHHVTAKAKERESVASLPEPTLEELARSCVGKKKLGEAAARKVALKFRQRAYHCVLCHGWHCTHLLPDIEVHG